MSEVIVEGMTEEDFILIDEILARSQFTIDDRDTYTRVLHLSNKINMLLLNLQQSDSDDIT